MPLSTSLSVITLDMAIGLIRHLNSEESADTFVPILIYVVLKANPENLLSNVEWVYKSRNASTWLRKFTGSLTDSGTRQSCRVRLAITCLVWYAPSVLPVRRPQPRIHVLRRWVRFRLLKPWIIRRYLILHKRSLKSTHRGLFLAHFVKQ